MTEKQEQERKRNHTAKKAVVERVLTAVRGLPFVSGATLDDFDQDHASYRCFVDLKMPGGWPEGCFQEDRLATRTLRDWGVGIRKTCESADIDGYELLVEFTPPKRKYAERVRPKLCVGYESGACELRLSVLGWDFDK